MQVTFGCSGSWFDDQMVAENITSSNAQSKQSRIARRLPASATRRRRGTPRARSGAPRSSAASSCSCCSAVATGWVMLVSKMSVLT